MPLLPLKATPEEVKKWVNSIDTNGDGAISDQELEKALRDLGLWFAHQRAEKERKKADSNRNGIIDTEEELKELLEHAQSHWGRAIHSKKKGHHPF